MPAWALQLRENDLEPLAALWHVAGVEAIRQDGVVWLRGGDADDATRRLLPGIACTGRFEVLQNGALLTPGQRVPLGYAPQGVWQLLRQFLSIALPPTSVASRTHSAVKIELVPADTESIPNLLLTDLGTWFHYSQQSPAIRLKNCRFAVCGDGRTLIHGVPLPPLTGTRAVACAGVVVPSGWGWSPGIDAEILAKSWGIEAGDLWLLWPGKAIERVSADQLVSANHSAIQLTWEAFQHGRTD